jgi:hypothetical protein
MQTSTPAMPLVIAAEEMSDENLLRHIEARHGAAYRGTAPLIPIVHPDRAARGEPFALFNRDGWTALHERLHRGDANHLHE